MEFRLEALSGPDVGSTLRYEGYGVVVFGRAGTSDRTGRRPSDPHVGREHVLFEVRRDGVAATAIRRAGFGLRGRTVAEASLAHGDEIEVGRSRFRVALDALAGEGDEPDEVARAVPRRALAEYRLGPEIGRGSWGVVSEATDLATGARVALKRLRGDVVDEVVRRYFVREVDVTARLSHPNVVRTLAVGREGDPPFLAMERVNADDLERRVGRLGPLPAHSTVEVGLGLLRALAHAHEAGIVHRDVKPANVLVLETPTGLEAKVADFGLARRFRDAGATSITQTGEARGTLAFAAPESLLDAKRAGPAADVFGAGATLYFALTGRPWFDAPGGTRPIDAILDGRLKPLRDVRPETPAALATVVEHALRREPRDRPSSAASALAAMVEAAASLDRRAGSSATEP